MGMSTMFSEEADFSDLLESPEPLQVSEVIHKAFIEVNEEGAEAAAATGILLFFLILFVCLVVKLLFRLFQSYYNTCSEQLSFVFKIYKYELFQD